MNSKTETIVIRYSNLGPHETDKYRNKVTDGNNLFKVK